MLDLKQENETDLDNVNMIKVFECYSEEELKEFAQDFDEVMEDMINQAKEKNATVFISQMEKQIADYLGICKKRLMLIVSKYSKVFERGLYVIIKGREMTHQNFNVTLNHALGKIRNNRRVMERLKNEKEDLSFKFNTI
jgi:hypothetical protein